jgi:hypothetical protein
MKHRFDLRPAWMADFVNHFVPFFINGQRTNDRLAIFFMMASSPERTT